METLSAAPRRGRVISSRYMNATASSRAAAVCVSAERKPTARAHEKAIKISTSVRRATTINATKPTHSNKKDVPPSASTTKHPSVDFDGRGSSGGQRIPGLHASQTSAGVAAMTAYELDTASQLYAWIFMRHTLTESSDNIVAEFQTTLATRVEEFEAEGEVLADMCLRFQAEWESQLLGDVSRKHLSCVVPTLIQAFALWQERCQAAVANAMRIQEVDSGLTCTLQTDIRDLDQLTEEATELYECIAALLPSLQQESFLAAILEDMLLLLDTLIENIALSKKVLATGNARHLKDLRLKEF